MKVQGNWLDTDQESALMDYVLSRLHLNVDVWPNSKGGSDIMVLVDDDGEHVINLGVVSEV